MSGFLNNIINNETVWLLIAASGAVTILLQAVKHWFQVSNEKIITVLLMTFSFAAPAIDYIMTTQTDSPKVIALRGMLVTGMTTPIYRFLIKPLYAVFMDAKAMRLQTQTQITPAPATQPVVDTTVVAPQEFSA